LKKLIKDIENLFVNFFHLIRILITFHWKIKLKLM